MSGNDWVHEGTPKEADDWGQEQDEYGVPVETAEWNDYSPEQTVPVPTPRQAEREIEPEPVAAAELEDAPEPAAEVLPEPEVFAEPEHEAFAEPGPEVFAEPEPEVFAEPEHEVFAEQEAFAEREPEVFTEPEPAAFAEPEPAAFAVLEAEPEPVAEFEAQLPVEPVDAEARPPRPMVVDGTDAAAEPFAAVEVAPDEAGVDHEAMTETRAIDTVPADPVSADGEATAPHEADDVAAAVGLAGLYREEQGERTQVIDTGSALAAEAAEEAQREEQLRLDKEARDQRLGLVATSEANALREPHPPRRPGLDGFGSFGMLMLRLVLAFSLGVAAWQILSDVNATAQYLGQTLLPYPREVAWALGFTLAAMAVMLVLGLGVRVVGFLLVVIEVGVLLFLRWGPFPIFVKDMPGFLGDRNLLLAALGLLLLSVGGGKIGIDGAISKARWNAKQAKLQ